MSCTEYCERLVNMPPMLLGNIGGISAHNTQAWNYDSVPVFYTLRSALGSIVLLLN